MNKTKSLLLVATLTVGGTLAFVGCKSARHHDHSSHSHGALETAMTQFLPPGRNNVTAKIKVE